MIRVSVLIFYYQSLGRRPSGKKMGLWSKLIAQTSFCPSLFAQALRPHTSKQWENAREVRNGPTRFLLWGWVGSDLGFFCDRCRVLCGCRSVQHLFQQF